MAFNFLPSKWTNNKRNNVGIRRDNEQEHPAYALQLEMNRLFDDFFRSWDTPLLSTAFEQTAGGMPEQGAVMPRIDVHETDKELRISAELPGMTEKDVDVSLSRDRLTISGEKKQENEQTVRL
jgi:HSP20 family protein